MHPHLVNGFVLQQRRQMARQHFDFRQFRHGDSIPAARRDATRIRQTLSFPPAPKSATSFPCRCPGTRFATAPLPLAMTGKAPPQDPTQTRGVSESALEWLSNLQSRSWQNW
jgi:hypothetical protein